MHSHTSRSLRSAKVGDSPLEDVELPPYEATAFGNGPRFVAGATSAMLTKRLQWSTPPPLPQTLPNPGERSAVGCRYHKTFLFCMMFFGLFHPFRLSDAGARWRVPALAYCSVILLGSLVNTTRLALTSIEPYESSLEAILYIPRLTFLAWHLTTSLSTAILYAVGLVRGGGAATYYGQLAETTRLLADAGMPVSDASRRRLNVIGLAVAWTLYIVNLAYSLPTLVDPSQFAAAETVIRWRLNNGTTDAEYAGVRGLELFAMWFGTGAYVFPVVYVFVVSGQVILLMNAFNGRLGRLADERPGELLERVAFYRRLHGSLCEAVACARSLIGYLLAVHLAINFLMSMLELFFVVNVSALDQYKELKISSGIWFATAVLIIASEFFAGCLVNEKVSACQEHLEKITDENLPQPSNHQLVQLQLFLAQLQQYRGYNVMGVLPINRDAILPMLGAWATYFLLVVQLGTTPSGADSKLPTSPAVTSNGSTTVTSASG